jgi:AcrR family transcriptional regulator
VPPPLADIYAILERAGSSPEKLSLRDRHKVDKLNRISEAATKLFSSGGYDGATLREIAREADVALGTIALYAVDKRDLVLLIFNQLIPPLISNAFQRARRETNLLDCMAVFFGSFYQTYANNVTLYRIVLGQLFGGESSIHAKQNENIRRSLISDVELLVRESIGRGELPQSIDVALQARTFYLLYFSAVRLWLGNDEPSVQRGVDELRELFSQFTSGSAGLV